MLPRFKYLSGKIFSPKNPDKDRYAGGRDGSQNPSVRVQPLAGEIFTSIHTNVKYDDVSPSGASHTTSGELFTGASNFTLNQPVFVDNSQTTSYFVVGFPDPVLPTLKEAGTLEAALNSAARYPPPKCHPGSRQAINGKLEKWLINLYRQRRMTWLYGPAGVGKSAVAQTFGELALERGCLGAAFFSAFDKLPTDSSRIIPTLAYQLAIHNPSYKQAITQQLAADPSILDAALPVQFQKFVVEPFSLLAPLGAQQATKIQPYVVILDGLDELENEDAQCELIELINSAAQRKDLPLVWLLCSRPESHIKYTFSKEEFISSCDREELLIDDEARADVERFLRDSFKEIRARYRFMVVVVGGVWPSEAVFSRISNAVSGYFVFASVVTRVVGDRTVGNPERQLVALLKMLQGLDDVGVNNPLDALDVFYSRILSRVPEDALSTAVQILGICARGEPSETYILNAEEFWLFFRIKREIFYYSLDKLHSVMRIPSPEDAQSERLTFYHKSFADYLGKQRRSGKFFISDARVRVLLGISGLCWYNHFLIYEKPDLVTPEEHSSSRAELKKWSSGDEVDDEILMRLASAAYRYYKDATEEVTEADTDFFDALCEFNFGLLTDSGVLYSLMRFMHAWDWSKTPAGSHFIRTDLFDEIADHKLFHHLSILANGRPTSPIDIHEPVVYSKEQALPWKGPRSGTMGYVVIGRGLKSCLACCYQEPEDLRIIILNSLTPPTTAQISQYRSWVRKIEETNHPELGKQHRVSTETRKDE